MKRVILFLATNLAVIVVLSITLRLLGVERILDAQGVDLDLKALLVFAAVFGMGGSFISLALSKWTAKRFTGAQVIGRPSNATEEWLVETVRRQAQAAGIGMPQVAVFESPAPNAFATGARRNHALVAVSTGRLQRMPREEVEAVLGHEVSHRRHALLLAAGAVAPHVRTETLAERSGASASDSMVGILATASSGSISAKNWSRSIRLNCSSVRSPCSARIWRS